MQQILKKQIIYLAKISVGLILVFWILSQVDRDKLVGYFLQLDAGVLFVIIVLSISGLIVQFARWKFLVEANSASFELKDLIPSFFAGFAFRLMVPGGHAEVSKIFLLPGRKRGKALAFGMEKFFQTYIKLLLILLAIPFSFPKYRDLCLFLAVVLIALYFILPRIPWLKHFQEKTVNNHILFAKTLFISLSVFLIMSAQYYILLIQIHDISILDTLQTVVYLWGAGLVPISISGLGVREGLAVYFLKMYEIPPAHAVATSLFLFFLNAVVPALIGIFFIYKRRADLKGVKETVQSTRNLIDEIRKKSNNKLTKKISKPEMKLDTTPFPTQSPE